MAASERTPTLGVSAIVRITHHDANKGLIPAGTIGMIVDQRPGTRHRYAVMIPGDPLATWYPAERLELVQGIDPQTWWRR
jgi:hypothetical protein